MIIAVVSILFGLRPFKWSIIGMSCEQFNQMDIFPSQIVPFEDFLET